MFYKLKPDGSFTPNQKNRCLKSKPKHADGSKCPLQKGRKGWQNDNNHTMKAELPGTEVDLKCKLTSTHCQGFGTNLRLKHALSLAFNEWR